MIEQGIRDAKVTLCIFKIDRIDFMGHGGRAHFSLNHSLLEIAQRNIRPGISAEIDEDLVRSCDGVEVLGHVIVRLDLCGVGIPLKAQRDHELRDSAGQSTSG